MFQEQQESSCDGSRAANRESGRNEFGEAGRGWLCRQSTMMRRGVSWEALESTEPGRDRIRLSSYKQSLQVQIENRQWWKLGTDKELKQNSGEGER